MAMERLAGAQAGNLEGHRERHRRDYQPKEGMRVRRILGVLLLLVLVAAACGDDDAMEVGGPDSDDTPAVSDEVPTVSDGLPAGDSGDAGGTVMAPIGPTITVAELLATEGDGPYSVMGYLFVLDDGTIVFSDLIAESYPPQPGGAQVEVRGVNLQTVPLVEPTDSELATVQWTETQIELIGSLDGDIFYGSTPASI